MSPLASDSRPGFLKAGRRDPHPQKENLSRCHSRPSALPSRLPVRSPTSATLTRRRSRRRPYPRSSPDATSSASPRPAPARRRPSRCPFCTGSPRLPAGQPGNSARVLVLSPTRELSGQIVDSFRTYGRHLRFSVTLAIGGVPIGKQIRALASGVDVLVATPGRLLDLCKCGAVSLAQVEVLVLDEADRMLDMGFINDIRRIVAHAAAAAPDPSVLGNHAGRDRPSGGRDAVPSGESRASRRPPRPPSASISGRFMSRAPTSPASLPKS